MGTMTDNRPEPCAGMSTSTVAKETASTLVSKVKTVSSQNNQNLHALLNFEERLMQLLFSEATPDTLGPIAEPMCLNDELVNTIEDCDSLAQVIDRLHSTLSSKIS